MHSVTKNQVGYDIFAYNGQFPPTEDTGEWEYNEKIADILEDSGIGDDDETWQGRLTEDWNGFTAGSLVIGGLSVEGYPFVVLSQY